MNRSRGLALILCAFALGACDDAASPDGTSSTATVRVYVDSDGSGGFSAGDAGVAGARVTLTPGDGGAAVESTTNASGVATFADLEPGSYTASLTGTVPTGAVLATATAPTLVAPFRGDSIGTEFRFVYNPGSVEGRLYRDNNGNNTFDAGDTPAPGIPVSLYAGSSATGTPVATTTTDANGQFSFTTLRPGTYTYAFTPLPTMTVVGGNSATVTVGAAAVAPLPVRFTGNLISNIDDIRTLPVGSPVAVEGVVTVGNAVLSATQAYIQDASGGVLVFGAITPGLTVGERVRVVGVTAVFSGETEIVAPTGGTLSVERLGTGTVPSPQTQTVAQFLTGNTEGDLVRLPGLTVISVSGTATSTAYNVIARDAAGTDVTVRVAAAAVGIPQTFWQVGRTYDVIGVASKFNNVPQLKPRSAADVQLRSNATPIGTVRAMAFADSIGTRFDTVTVVGVVHTAQGTFRTDNAFIQDATGGILLFNVPTSAGLVVGDSVRVTAAIDWFSRELELVRFSSTSPPVIEKLGTGATPQPRTISGAQMLSRLYEGQLVRLANVRVDSAVITNTGTGAANVFVTAADGSRVQVRIENNSIGLPASSWTVGSIVNVVGALSHNNGNPQVKPRNAADVTVGVGGIITIAAAEQRPAGDTVTVEGVVTAAPGPFGTAVAYIDDGTAGIQLFGVPTDVTLNVGDIIRVRGLTGVNVGELEIMRFSSTSLLQITKLGSGATPRPRNVTGAQMAARTFEGELLHLDNVVVVSIGAVSGSGGYNVTVRAADGTEFIVRNDRTAVGVPVGFWVVGNAYDVTGIATGFNGTPQLKLRSAADATAR